MSNGDIQIYNPWLLREEIGIFKALLISIRDIIFRPVRFFGGLSDVHPASDARSFYAAFLLLEMAIGTILALIAPGGFRILMNIGFLRLAFLAVMTLLAIGIAIIGLYLVSFIIHCIALLLRAKGGYSGTLSVLSYANALSILFLPLHFITIFENVMAGNALLQKALLITTLIYAAIVSCWTVIVLVIGYMKIHGFGVIRAILLLILPLVIAVSIALLIVGKEGLRNIRKSNICLERVKCERTNLPAIPRQLLTLPAAARQPYAGASINWGYDIDAAFSKAKSSNRYIMADFYTDWCGWCKKLDQDTYSDREVIELSQDMACVKVNGDKNVSQILKYGVRGYPTIIIFAPDGKEVERIPGYVDARNLALKLKQFARKSATAAATPQATGGTVAIDNIKQALKKTIGINLKLGGTVKGASGIKAIINDQVVGEGDEVEGYRVTKILPNKVVLKNKDNAEITLE